MKSIIMMIGLISWAGISLDAENISNLSLRISTAQEIMKGNVLQSIQEKYFKNSWNATQNPSNDESNRAPFVERLEYNFEYYWNSLENVWAYAYDEEQENKLCFLGILVASDNGSRFYTIYISPELDQNEQQELHTKVIERLLEVRKNSPIYFNIIGRDLNDRLKQRLIPIPHSLFSKNGSSELSSNIYSWLLPPNLYECALIGLHGSFDLSKGSRADFDSLHSLVDPNKVYFNDNHTIIDVSEKTSENLVSYFQDLAKAGIKKIIVYFTGVTQNAPETPFPKIILKNGEFLRENDLREILLKAGFELVIIGFDSANLMNPNDPIPVTYATKANKFWDENADYLSSRNGNSDGTSKTVPGIWDFKGLLSFSSSSIGEISFAHYEQGGLFTRSFVTALFRNNGNWDLALKEVRELLTNYGMNPFWQSNLSCDLDVDAQ